MRKEVKQTMDENINNNEVPLKVKVGEKEYDQDSLAKLVGLGETAIELETKWNTPLNRVVPEFTKKSQRLAEIEPEFNKLKQEREQLAARQTGSQEVTPEQRDQARKAIIDLLGGDVMMTADFDKQYALRRAGEQLLEKTQDIVETAKKQGKPAVEVNKLLEYMGETGFKDPEKAYKDMFEPELDKWKEEQLKKAKPSGFTSQGFSSAGSKHPEPIKPTRDNLSNLLGQYVNRES